MRVNHYVKISTASHQVAAYRLYQHRIFTFGKSKLHMIPTNTKDKHSSLISSLMYLTEPKVPVGSRAVVDKEE